MMRIAVAAALVLLATASVPAQQAEEVPERFQPKPAKDGTLYLTLKWLGNYDLTLPRYDDPEILEKLNDQIPEWAWDLDDKPIQVDGFALPLEFASGAVTRFFLTPDQMGCCFGGAPGFNQVVEVVVAPPGKKGIATYGAYAVRGKLVVGAAKDESGYVTSLYRLEAESVEENADFAAMHQNQSGLMGDIMGDVKW